MLKFGNKEFRNLQEQVKKNMDDILFILQEEGVLNEFGIKVVGQETSVLDMPTVEQYKEDNPDWSFGDAYAIGTEAPYELYILTRANGTHPDDYWFNIGEFPVPGPQGEEGPQGETGPQGPTGPSGQDGVSPEFSIGTVSASTLSAGVSATASVTQTGTYAQPVLNFTFGIPEGQAGSATTTLPWGAITGSIANQTDLVSALQNKANVSALSSYATQVYADNVGNGALSSAKTYTDTSIQSLSSIYAPVGDYATNTALSSAISGVNSTISSLNYASVGALSSGTFIPSVYGSNDGTNWTNLTINGSTYGFATGDLSGVARLNSNNYFTGKNTFNSTTIFNTWNTEFNNAVWFSSTVAPMFLNGQIRAYGMGTSDTGTYWYTLPQKDGTFALLDDIPSTSEFATVVALDSAVSSINNTITGLSSIYAPVGDYATNTSLNSAVSNINSTIAALNYLSVGALSSGTVIPDITGLASEGYVNNSISALSSIYAPVGDYATNTSLNDAVSSINSTISSLSSIYAPVGNYADLSAENVFTGSNIFSGSVKFSSDAIYRLSAGLFDIIYKYSLPSQSGTLALTSDIPSVSGYAALSASNIFTSANHIPHIYLNSTSATGGVAQIYLSGRHLYMQTGANAARLYLSDYYSTITLSEIALKSDIPSVSEFATVTQLSSAVSDINTTISGLSSIYAPVGDYATNTALSSSISALSSVYAPIDYIPSAISGYASEVFTFTLSDNTTVSKTFLVG